MMSAMLTEIQIVQRETIGKKSAKI